MNFCQNCNNLLHPIEILHNNTTKLILKCQKCGNIENNENSIIYSNNYKSEISDKIPNKKWLKYDNTLPRTIHQKCPNKSCISHKQKKLQESTIYVNKITKRKSFICVNCITEWTN